MRRSNRPQGQQNRQRGGGHGLRQGKKHLKLQRPHNRCLIIIAAATNRKFVTVWGLKVQRRREDESLLHGSAGYRVPRLQDLPQGGRAVHQVQRTLLHHHSAVQHFAGLPGHGSFLLGADGYRGG